MNEEKKKLGEVFRDKRSEMHLSLKEVENATSIRVMYLQAIEDGVISKYLSPVYALGFIKQYANFLGLDGEKFIKDHSDLFKMGSDKEGFQEDMGSIDVKESSKKKSNLFWIVASLGILVLAWYFAKFLGVV